MKTQLSKLLLLILALMLTVSMLAGCGGTTAEPTTTPDVEEATVEDVPVSDETKLLGEIQKKNVELTKVYNEVTDLAITNGWEADELAVAELNGASAIIMTFTAMHEDPTSAEGADLPELLAAAGDLITELDTNFRQKVSVPYVSE